MRTKTSSPSFLTLFSIVFFALLFRIFLDPPISTVQMMNRQIERMGWKAQDYPSIKKRNKLYWCCYFFVFLLNLTIFIQLVHRFSNAQYWHSMRNITQNNYIDTIPNNFIQTWELLMINVIYQTCKESVLLINVIYQTWQGYVILIIAFENHHLVATLYLMYLSFSSFTWVLLFLVFTPAC